MKKLFLLLSLCSFIFSFAAIDTDSDGVSDEKDLCPHVYSQSETGCPALAKVVVLPALNACYQKQSSAIIVRVQPICDATTKICPALSSVSGIQSCDIIFPLLLKDGQPFVR